MFSRCSGSSKYVHTECLNKWRRMAPNDRVYYECDLCKYQYRIQRTVWADYLEHPKLAATSTFIVVIIAFILVGAILLPTNIHNWAYQKIEWEYVFL